MSTNVEPEEVQAILDLFSNREGSRGPADVSQRDFRQPLRIAPEALGKLDTRLQRARTAAEQTLRDVLGTRFRMKVAGLREASAEGLFHDATAPLALGRFTVAGQPGWIVWQNPAAVAAIEVVLGAEPAKSADGSERPARELTAIERSVLGRLLVAVVSPTLEALGLEGTGFQVVVEPEDIGSWRDGEPDGEAPLDAHRLGISWQFDGPGNTSTFHLYLPGFVQDAASGHHAVPAELPAHLAPVGFGVGVLLGESEVSLAALLELEVGDVIPLSADRRDPLVLHVEGMPCATGTLGTSEGRLALRVDQVHLPHDR